jgi:cysteine desulfurase
MIYLDHAASSPLKKSVLNELRDSFESDAANPSAIHKLGKYQQASLLKAKISFLKSLSKERSVLSDQFLFTSSATESNTTIIQGLSLKRGDQVFYSEGDHASLVQNVKKLENLGITTTVIPLTNQGLVNKEWLAENLSSSVKLFIISHVNNHNGSIQDLDNLSKLIKEMTPQCHLHIDAVQSYGSFEIDVVELKIDSLTLSGHKISGPKGIAGLYINKKVKVAPLLIGGGHQDGLRSSTEATSLVKAFNVAREEVFKDEISKYQQMNIFLRAALQKNYKNIVFPYDLKSTSPKILTFFVKNISSDILLRHLEEKEIYISSSSACSSRLRGVSPVFSALNIAKEDHKFILRVSLGWNNTIEQLEMFCKQFHEILNDLEFLLNK